MVGHLLAAHSSHIGGGTEGRWLVPSLRRHDPDQVRGFGIGGSCGLRPVSARAGVNNRQRTPLGTWR